MSEEKNKTIEVLKNEKNKLANFIIKYLIHFLEV